MANSQDLESMKLPELKELAKQMGLRGTSTMRKPELLATLQAARSGGEACRCHCKSSEDQRSEDL